MICVLLKKVFDILCVTMIEEVGHALTNLLDQTCCIMSHSTTFS